MRKLLTSAMAAITATGALLAAQPAQADRWRHHRDNDNDEVAAAVVAGIAGLAIGAALAGGSDRDDRYDDRNRRYDGYGRYGYSDSYRYRYNPYNDSYYGRSYNRRDRYDYGRTCVSRERVYDPYIGRRVTIERRYRC